MPAVYCCWLLFLPAHPAACSAWSHVCTRCHRRQFSRNEEGCWYRVMQVNKWRARLAAQQREQHQVAAAVWSVDSLFHAHAAQGLGGTCGICMWRIRASDALMQAAYCGLTLYFFVTVIGLEGQTDREHECTHPQIEQTTHGEWSVKQGKHCKVKAWCSGAQTRKHWISRNHENWLLQVWFSA